MSVTSHISPAAIARFQSILLAWFTMHGRVLPWRESGLGDYELFIAEVLLQRTKAENVANYYPRFLASFPSWDSLANTDRELLEEYLRPLELAAQHAPRLKALAGEMVARHGKIPRDRADLKSIPLAEQHIANAIEKVIFDQPSPCLLLLPASSEAAGVV